MKISRLYILSGFCSAAFALVIAFQPLNPAWADESAVAATWNNGWVYIFGNYSCSFSPLGHPDTKKECLDVGYPDAKKPLPVVIFLHGCSEWNNRQGRIFNLIKENGITTFIPYSFGRPGRSEECGNVIASGTLDLRLEEIRYAVEQIKKLSWVDQSRLLLAGFSEGGLAAAYYDGNDFRAIMIFGWGCGKGFINAPDNIPVLNIVGKNDYETPHGNVLCHVGKRPNSKAVHVDAGHDISQDPASWDEINAFLEKVLKQ